MRLGDDGRQHSRGGEAGGARQIATPPAVRRLAYGRQRWRRKYSDVRQALIDAGWQVVRQRGSHEVWAHPDREERIVVAGKDRDTVLAGTLGSIRRASGLQDLR